MICKKIKYSKNKFIWIYDDVLEFLPRQKIFSMMSESLFLASGSDAFGPRYRQFYSKYSAEDLTNLNILNQPNFLKISKQHDFESYTVRQIRVNAIVPSEKNQVHADQDGMTIIYHANMDWKLDWGGHFFITNENYDDIFTAIAFKPGRVLVMDGSIPHFVQTGTPLSQEIRFSLIIQLTK